MAGTGATVILRRCFLSVLFSYLMAINDIYFTAKSWMLHFKCSKGEAVFLDTVNGDPSRLAPYRVCMGDWGDYVLYYKFIHWAIIATIIVCIGPLIEAVVLAVLTWRPQQQQQQQPSRQQQHHHHHHPPHPHHRRQPTTSTAPPAIVLQATPVSTGATVLSGGLWAKTQQLRNVFHLCDDRRFDQSTDLLPVRHLFKLKLVEVITKGVMVALAATVVMRDAAIAGLDGAVPGAAGRGSSSGSSGIPRSKLPNASPAGWPASPGPVPSASSTPGDPVILGIQTKIPLAALNKWSARPVTSFRASDEYGAVASPSWWAISEMAFALVTAAHAASGFIWYCSASSWSSVSNRDFGSGSSRLSRVCAYLPFPFLHLFLFQLATLYSTVMVYTYFALHLFADFRDARLAFLLLLGRWVWQLLVLWLACLLHRCRWSFWLSSIWKSLVSSFTYMPWAVPGASKWGLTFWVDTLGTTVFALAGNAYFVLKHEEVGATKTTFSVRVIVVAAALSLVVPVGALLFQALCWIGDEDNDGQRESKDTGMPPARHNARLPR